MPKLSKSSPDSSKKARMHEEMKKFSEGNLHSGSRTGPLVSKRSQAIAIGLSESGQSRKIGRKSARSRGRR